MSLIRTAPAETSQVIHALIVGPGGSGKSTAAATFPNPLFLSLDNNIPPEIRRSGIQEIPFYDIEFITNAEFINDLIPSKPKQKFKERLELLGCYLRTEARLLPPTQTIVIDHLADLNDLVMDYVNRKDEAEIKKNPRALWSIFAEYMLGVFQLLKNLKCNVVMIAQEDELRDIDTNRVLGRRWLMPGKQFSPRVPNYFNNVLRQTKVADEIGASGASLLNPKFNAQAQVKESYYWQIRKDAEFDAIRTTIPGTAKFVPADYKSFNIK